MDRDFADDARCIAGPIAHCGFAGEDRAFFSGLGDYAGDDENSREKDCAQNWIAQSTSFHLSLTRWEVKYLRDLNPLPRKYV